MPSSSSEAQPSATGSVLAELVAGQADETQRLKDFMATLEEFLDIYDAALDVDLDSENVWPMPPPLKFL